MNLAADSFRRQADVNEQVLPLQLLALAGRQQVNRLLRWLEYAGKDLARSSMHLDTLGHEHARIESTDFLDTQESAVVNVAHEESDFIDVSRDRDSRAAR